MFAVKGWSLSSDKIKTDNNRAAAATASESKPEAPADSKNDTNSQASSKKRKRPIGPNGTSTSVTTDNVADLWSKVIDKREKKDKTSAEDKVVSKEDQNESAPVSKKAKKDKKDKKSDHKPAEKEDKSQQIQKMQKTQNTAKAPKEEQPTKPAPATAQEPEKPQSKKQQKEDKKKRKQEHQAKDQVGGKNDNAEKKGKPAANKEAAAAPSSAAVAAAAPLALPPAPPALTPLQAAMRAKLVSARFRHLNETLYTTPSAEALRLFSDSPDMFQAYHEGFRQQVAVWPENPVDSYIAEVRARAGGKAKAGRGDRPGDSLPRSFQRGGAVGICRIADVGCGDARLAAALNPAARKLRVEVKSYDLHADPANPHITAAADAANLPLPENSTDVVVFCLALMGTNWLSFVEEAYRILRWKGELWVAEIKSRFAGAAELRMRSKAVRVPVAHSVGNRRKNIVKNGKKGKGGADDPEFAEPDVVAAAVSKVDGLDEDGLDGSGGGMATDVAAFVRALQRRGFVLDDGSNGDGTNNVGTKPPAVDLSNKMFVRMRFLKAASAEVGKEAVNPVRQNNTFRKKPKFTDEDAKTADPMDDPALEAKILKPCVYKLR